MTLRATAGLLSGAPRSARPVRDGVELRRVLALPRRPAAPPPGLDLTPSLTTPEGYRKGLRLRPVQTWALYDFAEMLGLLGPIGCGEGKTLITLLAPTLIHAERPVLIIPAALFQKTLRAMSEARAQGWLVHPKLVLMSYEELSSPGRGPEALAKHAPDCIMLDEAHYVRDLSATRTRRLLHALTTHAAGVPVMALSGTLIARSIRDFAHLAAATLGDGAPVPLTQEELAEWSEAIDCHVPSQARRSEGALSALPGAGDLRARFHARVVETPGVVSTVDSIPTGLTVQPWRPTFPRIEAALRELATTGFDPEGVDCSDPADYSRVSKALALGFYYRWVWPGGQPDIAWLEARNGWNRAVRTFLEDAPAPGLDSPALVARACARGDAPTSQLARCWASWEPLALQPPPPVEGVWLTDEALQAVLAWADVNPCGIVWVHHREVLAALERLGLEVRHPNTTPPAKPLGRAWGASMASFGTGHNLQAWSANLVLTPPSSAGTWEQLLARTHRPGQEADTVEVDVLLHHGSLERAFEAAREEAAWVESTTGQPQRLRKATFLGGL